MIYITVIMRPVYIYCIYFGMLRPIFHIDSVHNNIKEVGAIFFSWMPTKSYGEYGGYGGKKIVPHVILPSLPVVIRVNT